MRKMETHRQASLTALDDLKNDNFRARAAAVNALAQLRGAVHSTYQRHVDR